MFKIFVGAVSLVAGVTSVSLPDNPMDGPATSAMFGRVYGLCVDTNEVVYFGDYSFSVVRSVSTGAWLLLVATLVNAWLQMAL